MQHRSIKNLIIFLAFSTIAGVLAVILIIIGLINKDSIGVFPNPGTELGEGSEFGSVIIDLLSDLEEEQVNAANLILAEPWKYASRIDDILNGYTRSRFPKVRITLTKVIARIGKDNPEVIKALETAVVSDKHHHVRIEATKALRSFYPEDSDPSDVVLKTIRKALEDEDEEVRFESMRFLFDHQSRKATEPILAYLSRPEAKHRWKAVEVLGRIKDPAASPTLLALLKDESADTAARSRACGVLGLMKSPRCRARDSKAVRSGA